MKKSYEEITAQEYYLYNMLYPDIKDNTIIWKVIYLIKEELKRAETRIVETNRFWRKIGRNK